MRVIFLINDFAHPVNMFYQLGIVNVMINCQIDEVGEEKVVELPVDFAQDTHIKFFAF